MIIKSNKIHIKSDLMKARFLSLIACLLAGLLGVANAQETVYLGSQVTDTTQLVSGNAYIVQYNAAGTPYVQDTGSKYSAPNSIQSTITTRMVYYITSDDNGGWQFKNAYTGYYWGQPTANSTSNGGGFIPSSTAGTFYLNMSSGVCNVTSVYNGTTFYINRSSQVLHAWSTSGGGFKIYEIDDAVILSSDSIYTITNANGRGSLIYYPDASDTWVWSSGKSGTFDATAANSQWMFYPTGNGGEYYLYNVGAQKFAIPVTGGSYSGYTWAFSEEAVPVTVSKDSDGYYVFATTRGSIHLGVSNSYTGPIISYYASGDGGLPFTIASQGEASSTVVSEFAAAQAKLIQNTTALSSALSSGTDAWYAIRLKTGTYADNFLFPCEQTYNSTSYALGFYNAMDQRPVITNTDYYFHITYDGSAYYWQLPDGRYLYQSDGNKFPLATTDATSITMNYSSSGFTFNGGSRYAVPYYMSSTYFIGETVNSGTVYYDVYPIDLDDAGLTAWEVVLSGAPSTAMLNCSRSDVVGESSVYSGGYFFLPAGETPTSSDFAMDGMISCTIDATNYTITATYDPTLALVVDGVNVVQGYQAAGQGNENTLLLRVDLEPFNDMTDVVMNVALTDSAVANLSSLYLYEGTDKEFIANIPTTQLATASEVASSVSFSLGSVTAGSHFYFLCATVKSDATLGAIMDAAVTSFSYTCNEGSQTLDVSSVGDPSYQGAKVFSQQNFVFLPTEDDCQQYRIPAMILDQNGDIVAAIDKRYNSIQDLGNHKIDVVTKRSEDGGVTWQDLATVAEGDGSSTAAYGFGDPALTRAADGTLVCVMAAGSKRFSSSSTDGMRYAGVARSSDNGLTWSLVSDIFSTENFYDEVHETTGSLGFSNLFTTSGKGLTTNDSIIMYAVNCTEMNTSSPFLCYILYSTDNGVSWRLSNALAYSGCDESKLEQLNDGTLLLSVRQSGNRGWNTATYTKNSDGTVTFSWGEQYRTSDIYGNACNADIIYYSRETDGDTDILLHSYINSTARESLQLAMSLDGGSSWNDVYNIQPKGAGYSTMQVLSDGTLAILYEDSCYNVSDCYAINYVTIPKSQITAWYEALAESLTCTDVKIAYGTTGEASYGSWSDLTWTSSDASGLAGVTLTLSSGVHDKYSSWNSRYNMAYKAATAGEDATFTLTAPEGYIIKSYSLEARNHTGGSTTLTADDGTTITTTTTAYQTLAVSGVNKQATAITVNAANTSNYLAISNFTLVLKAYSAGDIDLSGEVDINDVSALVSVLFGTAEAGTYNAEAADVNGDGSISLSDLPELIKLLQE